jgi:putative ABC transport system permease protein
LEWRTNIWLRLKALIYRRRMERDLEEEIGFHLSMRERKLEQIGFDAGSAHYAARTRFGNVTLWKEEAREMRTFAWLETIWRDVLYAVRTLRKSPGFLAVVVLSLALGIGANSTIFSVINAVMLRRLPYEQPDRLMALWQTVPGQPGERNAPPIAETVDWKKQNDVFEDIALTSFTESGPVSGMGEAEQAQVQNVSPNFFALLGAKPLLGRVFLTGEIQDTTQTIVISSAFWKRRFNSDPRVLGRTLNVSGVASTIAGVMPPGFGSFYGERLDLWQPVNPESARYSERQDHWLMAIGRLKPHVSRAQAQGAMDVIARRLEQAYPATNKGVGAKVIPLHESLDGGAARYLYPLLGAVVFVLLIACANAANLMQSRAETHRKEFALRASLGAGRRRLIQQLLVESGILGLAAGALGVGLTVVGIQLFRALAGEFQNASSIAIDGRVLLFTLAISLATALLAGLAPALQSSNPHLNVVLREGDRRTAGSRGLTRYVLAVSEISMAMVLLVGAGLMINSLLRLHRVDPGFDPSNLLTFDIYLPEGGRYVERLPGGDMERTRPTVTAFYRQLIDRVTALPGVEAAGLLGGNGQTFSVLGRPLPPLDKRPRTTYDVVSSGFFRALKVPLKKGRYLNDTDVQSAPWAAVISETFAKRYFPNEDPIGQQLLIRIADTDDKQPRRIVGVVGDIKFQLGQRRQRLGDVYASFLQQGTDFRGGNILLQLAHTLIVRSRAGGVAAAVKKAVAEVDPEQPINDIMTMNQILEQSVGDSHFYARLLEVFATLALLLAAMGIYGSMSYFVSERTHEIGIRMALGARRTSVLAMVAKLGLKLAGIGVAIGVMLALGLTRVISEFLFGVTATDPVTFCLVAAGLTAIALLACYVPARRATKVDPMVALRHE